MSSNEHPDMSGSGCDDPEQICCPVCNGTGRVMGGGHSKTDPDVPCKNCEGTGAVDPPDYEPEMDDVL